MKVIQRTLPKKLQHHVPKKATKHRNTDKLSLKEQYLYHIAQDVNEPSQIKPIPPSYEYEIPSKKSKKQLVRDVQYLEKLCMKYSAIETPQLSKVVRHLPFLVAYNKERIHSDRSDESIPSTSSKRARKMDKGTEEVYDVEDFDNIADFRHVCLKLLHGSLKIEATNKHLCHSCPTATPFTCELATEHSRGKPS